MAVSNASDIASILRRYPTRRTPRQIQILGNAGGYSGAILARIDCKDEVYCLRGWPKPQGGRKNALLPDRILGLHRLLREVFAKGMEQVAVPLQTVDGRTLIEEHGRFWQLEPWKPGAADFHQNPTRRRLHAAMSCLARWHNAAADFVPTDSERTWFYSERAACSPAIDDRCERLREWRTAGRERVQREVFRAERNEFRGIAEQVLQQSDRLSPGIASQLELARGMRFALQPCLRDIWHDHVLFTGDVVTGLIDPSATRAENVATDLARLIGSLVGDERERRRQALDAYQAMRKLSLQELILFELLDRSGVLISGMNWLEWLFVDRRRFDQPERVAARLREILKRLEHLAQTI